MHRDSKGFTLAELVVALGIVAIGLLLALPALGAALQRNRTQGAYHLLISSLMSARSAAITRRHPVSACPSSDGTSCRNDLVWDSGWIIFLDPQRTGTPASAAAVLRRVQSPAEGIAIRSTVGRHRVRFHTTGQSLGSNLSLRLCSRGDRLYLGRLIVSNTGRPRVERPPVAGAPCPYPL
ncbi:MAG: GspH/FimT family pseudopilin [Pseudomonadota bacterium]|nr:GspH/FimT family pseudopilin [Pseudomonadota bacterium]